MEVSPMVALSDLPGAPSWVRGVADVRGTLAPVVDLGGRLGLHALSLTLATPIVFVRGRRDLFGVAVDEVGGVVAAEELPMAELARSPLVKGLGRAGDRVLLILDPDELLGEADTTLVQLRTAAGGSA